MRDGVRLHAVILRPADLRDALRRACHFCSPAHPTAWTTSTAESVNHDKPELAASNYIFVYEDIRGRYRSEGSFVMKPSHRSP